VVDSIQKCLEGLIGVNGEKGRDDGQAGAFLDVGLQKLRNVSSRVVISDA